MKINKLTRQIFRTMKYFSVLCIGAALALCVEYGIDATVVVLLTSSAILLGITATFTTEKYITEKEM